MKIPVLNTFATDTSVKGVKTLTFKLRNFLDVWTWEHIESGVISCKKRGRFPVGH